jgi:hypothetical protein
MALERLEAGTPIILHSRLGRNPFWLLLLEQFSYQAAGRTE